MDSEQHAHPPPIFCPYARFENEEDEFRSIQFGESPILLPSSSSHSRRPLDWCDNKDDKCYYRICYICWMPPGTEFYSCKECYRDYHKECIEPITRHPYHPKHSLRFLKYDKYDSNSRDKDRYICCSCHYNSIGLVYHCSLCNFTICQVCARKPPLLAIDHPKRHEHTLFYSIRKASFTCDVCALSCDTYPVIRHMISSEYHRSLVYFCLQCDFVVHKDCIYLPWIIRISRHEHRLSFDYSLAPQKRSCGVCRGKIDTNYGRYSCVKGCSYGVHSKCATQDGIWDGKELEGEPEDAYEEDLKLFNEISDGIIQHLSHPDHHMQLGKESDKTFQENKHCQACAFPVNDDIVYNCMQCDFMLHEACAHLPRKKQHAVHPHPLLLIVMDPVSWFKCDACLRVSNGFGYVCGGECRFRLGVCCASVSEPFDYRCHQHLLFFTASPDIQERCSICRRYQEHRLNCGECDFILCFGCATLPNKQRYKHDEHFLFLSYDKNASGQYWCDVCEEEADPKKKQVYMCNDCNVTLHTECLLGVGEDMYIIPHRLIKNYRVYADIFPNNHLTRNTCKKCHNYCQGKIVFKISEKEIVCSFNCLTYYS